MTIRFPAMLTAAVLAASTMLGTTAFAQDAKDTLRVGMYSKSVPRGNVYAIQNIWPSMFWWEAVYDSFVRVDENAKVVPHAAARWELVNPTTWRLTFRDDVTFSNGRKNDAANIVKVFDKLVPEDEWFTQHIIADGDHIIIRVNGHTTVDTHDSTYRKGYIALQAHDPGSIMMYRDLRFRDLSKTKK